MDKYKQETLNKHLKGLADEYQQEYDKLHQASYNHFLKSMKPGQVIPQNKAFYDSVYEGSFHSLCADLQTRARMYISDALQDLNRQANEAPTQEALTAVQMVAMRKNITERDIYRLIDAYGSNPMTYTTIQDIAAQHDIHGFENSPVYEQIEELEALQTEAERAFNPYKATNGDNAVLIAAETFKADVDRAVPTE